MNFILKNKNNIFNKIIFSIISFYQKIVSPMLPARCRYYPTCSNYGKQALAWYGVRSGSWLLLKRISRCHPLGGHGIDFVPIPLASYSYHYVPAICTENISAQGLGIYRDSSSYVSRLNQLMMTESK